MGEEVWVTPRNRARNLQSQISEGTDQRPGLSLGIGQVVSRPWKTKELRKWNYGEQAPQAEGRASQCFQELSSVQISGAHP